MGISFKPTAGLFRSLWNKLSAKFFTCIIFVYIVLFNVNPAFSQCDPITPNYVIDLTSNPDSIWTSPSVSRKGHCCGGGGPNRCVSFVVTLNPNADRISFSISNGAIPGGALFYQINCGSPSVVGDEICISGVGPHLITFCKPGGNSNEYSIQSYPKPVTSSDVTVNMFCVDLIAAINFDNSTIHWTSVNPGPDGMYDSYLDCDTCDTAIVTPDLSAPPYIDYQICGYPLGNCAGVLVCDTVRVNVVDVMTIVPDSAYICYGDSTIVLTAYASGGLAPYTYSWSTGDTTQSIVADTGFYQVQVTDGLGCLSEIDTSVVTLNTQAVTAISGPDQNICVNNSVVNLNGNVILATGGVWSGGSGTFIPDSALSSTYTPTAAEVASGALKLYLTTTGSDLCDSHTDSLMLNFFNPPSANAGIDDSICGNSTFTVSTAIAADYTALNWTSSGTGVITNNGTLTP